MAARDNDPARQLREMKEEVMKHKWRKWLHRYAWVCADPSEASRSGFTDRPDRAPGSQTPKGLALVDTCGCTRLESIASLCAREVLLDDGAAGLIFAFWPCALPFSSRACSTDARRRT